MKKNLKIKFSVYKPESLGFGWAGLETAVVDIPICPPNPALPSASIFNVGKMWIFAFTILNCCFQVSLFCGYTENNSIWMYEDYSRGTLLRSNRSLFSYVMLPDKDTATYKCTCGGKEKIENAWWENENYFYK
mgnify:CR=1 FL=1